MENQYPVDSWVWMEYEQVTGRLFRIMSYFHGIKKQPLMEVFDNETRKMRILAIANIKSVYRWGPFWYAHQENSNDLKVVFGHKVIFINTSLRIIPDVTAFPSHPEIIPFDHSIQVQSSGVIVVKPIISVK
jgi:hypothetical protein